MISDFPWPIFVVAGALLGTLLTQLVQWMQQKQASLAEAERITREAEYEGREERKLRDQQLNHGRRVCNWLKKQLASYEANGLFIEKIEDNGGDFWIAIGVKTQSGSIPIVQLSYDFLSNHEPYRGHVHYSAYGLDLLFWVSSSQDQFEYGLNELVIEKVKEYFTSREN